jgi:hypothetical protein
MNEQPAVHYYDRSTGLMIFGGLTVMLGVLVALMCVLLLFVAAFASVGPSVGPQVHLAQLIPALFIYAVISIILITLGAGSIFAKRWARALLLVSAWYWLVAGTIGVGFAACIMPQVLAKTEAAQQAQMHGRALPPGVTASIVVFSLIFDGFILIVIPAIWAFFYGSRHVKLTCEWRNPEPCWTDACPLPVLGLCLLTVLAGLYMPVMAFTGFAVAPFFGMFVTGVPGTLVYLGLAAVYLISGGMMYRLDWRGWWLFFITMLLGGISTLMTYWQHSIVEMYQLMHFPDDQVEQIRQTGIFEGHSLVWASLIWLVPVFGFMLYIRRYFRATT